MRKAMDDDVPLSYASWKTGLSACCVETQVPLLHPCPDDAQCTLSASIHCPNESALPQVVSPRHCLGWSCCSEIACYHEPWVQRRRYKIAQELELTSAEQRQESRQTCLQPSKHCVLLRCEGGLRRWPPLGYWHWLEWVP